MAVAIGLKRPTEIFMTRQAKADVVDPVTGDGVIDRCVPFCLSL